jgi:photosystem II stability/assembly factor-like uncharacterized protein
MTQRRILVILAALSAAAAVSQAQSWIPIGPAPISGDSNPPLASANSSGLISDIAIDPSGSTDSTIYIATSAGGVWKTTNGGSNWIPTTDSMPVLTMGAVALDPSNPSIVYAGVGGPHCCYTGGGIYLSTDAAVHWTQLNPNGIFTGVPINRIVLPASGTLLVATTKGLYESVNGGNTFGNNAPTFDNSSPIPFATPLGSVSNGNVSDLHVDTVAPGTVYAAVDYQGIFKSTDSGTTFPASGQILGFASFPETITGTGDVYIKFAQSTLPNNQTMYAFLCLGTAYIGNSRTGEPCALLKSTDLGASFAPIRLGPDLAINQQDYDQIIGVDPQDPNRVYIGLRDLFFSADGGSSGFGPGNENQLEANGPHVDDHAIAFSPASHFTGTGPPTLAYFGTDGGFASTAANGSAPGSQWQFLNNGLATALMMDMDIGRGSPANNAYTYGSFWDNGISAAIPGGSGISDWTQPCCGDGISVTVDPSNPLHALGLDDGCLASSTNAQNWPEPTCNSNFPQNTGALGLVRFDPNGGVAYAAGGVYLFQSIDNGQTFLFMHTFPKPITTIDQVAGNSNLIWAGFNDGTLQVTSNALQGSASTWSAVTVSGCARGEHGLSDPNSAPSGQSVSGIAIDPNNPSTVVAVYPGFSGSADPPKHAFLTTDGGACWRNIGGTLNGGFDNLPDIPLDAVVIIPTTSPHTIVVGSDIGVMQTADMGKTWQVLGTGFPVVKVSGFALDYTANPVVLRAATFGRSAFQLEGSCPLCPPAPVCTASTDCIGELSISCTGPDVGVVFNGNCYSPYGEPVGCYAGFNGSSTVTAGGNVYWLGSTTSPNTAEACTTNAGGQTTCISVTASVPTGCTPGTTLPGNPCFSGLGSNEIWCAKLRQCLPPQDYKGVCLVTPIKPEQ